MRVDTLRLRADEAQSIFYNFRLLNDGCLKFSLFRIEYAWIGFCQVYQHIDRDSDLRL
jgi:hypothetical protein